MSSSISIFWHRRDLRTEDLRPLSEALQKEKKVLPLFIFDTNILNRLENKKDARVEFIHRKLKEIKTTYQEHGSDLLVKIGEPLKIWKEILNEYKVEAVYAGRDYEPYALERDKAVYEFLQTKNIRFYGFKDHVIFEKSDIVKDDGKPYTVFTPYSKKWKGKLQDSDLALQSCTPHFKKLYSTSPLYFPSLKELGFEEAGIPFPEEKCSDEIIKNYHETRDIPSLHGTSRLSLHLRFGTISVRQLTRSALKLNEKYLNELIWREFYQMILYHFPHTVEKSFKPAFDNIQWENNEAHFEAWCKGKTGYPLVDAGMRELNATGWMHNRTRMVVASFLTKHLLIDWRWGEAYFKEKLLDYECASNIGGWQWACGSGTDAAPYFRVFNPTTQQENFDPDKIYIKKWIPEYGTKKYPDPIIDHTFARDRILKRFKFALDEKKAV